MMFTRKIIGHLSRGSRRAAAIGAELSEELRISGLVQWRFTVPTLVPTCLHLRTARWEHVFIKHYMQS